MVPMSATKVFRAHKRSIGQMLRRLKGERPESRLVSDLRQLEFDLRRDSDMEPEAVCEVIVYLIETIPPHLMELDDPLGHVTGCLDQIYEVLVNNMVELLEDSADTLDRHDIMERLFCSWVGDDTGFLSHLDDVLLAMMTVERDEAVMMSICQEHLRHMPLVFPAAPGEKLELERSILQSDRHRVERLLGEILHRRGIPDYAVMVAASCYRNTGDAVDYLKVLMRAGLEQEAREVARRVLHNPRAVRAGKVREIYEELIRNQEGRRKELQAARDAFLKNPSEASLRSVLRLVPEDQGEDEVRRIVGELEKSGQDLDIAFQLYLSEGLLLEADALVVTKPLDPYVLAQAADLLLDVDTLKAAGWLVVAAHHLMKKARLPQYRLAAEWLATVRTVSEAIGQGAAFERTLDAFKDRYRRRTALLRILGEAGL